jgi:hypothetical protein
MVIFGAQFAEFESELTHFYYKNYSIDTVHSSATSVFKVEETIFVSKSTRLLVAL